MRSCLSQRSHRIRLRSCESPLVAWVFVISPEVAPPFRFIKGRLCVIYPSTCLVNTTVRVRIVFICQKEEFAYIVEVYNQAFQRFINKTSVTKMVATNLLLHPSLYLNMQPFLVHHQMYTSPDTGSFNRGFQTTTGSRESSDTLSFGSLHSVSTRYVRRLYVFTERSSNGN